MEKVFMARMIWRAMFGNGAMIGTATLIIKVRLHRILWDQIQMNEAQTQARRWLGFNA